MSDDTVPDLIDVIDVMDEDDDIKDGDFVDAPMTRRGIGPILPPSALYGTLDATAWAEEFDKLDLDLEEMVAWFAAAIAVGLAAGRREAREAREALERRIREVLG